MADNVDYVVFNKHGAILRYGNCPGSANLYLMADPMLEEYVTVGRGSDMTHEVLEDFTVAPLAVPHKVVKTWQQSRRDNYPKIETYLDAQVKLNSNDAELIQVGQQEFAAYVARCLAVKKTFPKK